MQLRSEALDAIADMKRAETMIDSERTSHKTMRTLYEIVQYCAHKKNDWTFSHALEPLTS